MSYEEAKDQIALMHGHANWMVAEYREGRIDIDLMYKEAAQIYAKAKWEEACEEQKKKCADFIDYNNPMTVKEMILMAPNPEFKP